VQLNLTGVFHGMKAGAPLILESGRGSIVSTASISASGRPRARRPLPPRRPRSSR
jgi:NAD(P)-dependent dehydrogenase (short-subunit alcohol dehydrogenase family)